MNAKMIKKVVPLSKILSTVFMITLKNLDKPLGLRIFESKYPKLFCLRNMLLNLYRFEVEGPS